MIRIIFDVFDLVSPGAYAKVTRAAVMTSFLEADLPNALKIAIGRRESGAGVDLRSSRM
jgi:hypothetical protein